MPKIARLALCTALVLPACAEETLEIARIRRYGNLEGRACNPTDGLPMTGATATLVDDLNDAHSAATDETGYFAMTQVPVGSWVIEVAAQSGASLSLAAEVVEGGNTIVGREICQPIIKETFVQGVSTSAKADVLFVVDNSGSMRDEQQNLGSSFDRFINWIGQEPVDYHIAVTTTDMGAGGERGAFVGSPAFLDQDTENITQVFRQHADVGTAGSVYEQGLAAAVAAFAGPHADSTNGGFLRPDANLYIVFVSDEDDQSPSSLSTYIEIFRELKSGAEDMVFLAAIAGDSPGGCSGAGGNAQAAVRYRNIVDMTGGLFSSICDSDFGEALESLAWQVVEDGGEYFLSAVPIAGTLQVSVDGIPQPAERWQYNAIKNSFRFYEGHTPAQHAEVGATYRILAD